MLKPGSMASNPVSQILLNHWAGNKQAGEYTLIDLSQEQSAT